MKKRLIDANWILGVIEHDLGCYEIGKLTEGDALCVELRDVVKMVCAAPTVDAMEVVHGRWIAVPSSDMVTGKSYKCSECNKMRYGSFMPNYCQNCGAKMDGDGNESA